MKKTPSTEIKGHIKGPNLCELRLYIGCELYYSTMCQENLAVVGLTENLGVNAMPNTPEFHFLYDQILKNNSGVK